MYIVLILVNSLATNDSTTDSTRIPAINSVFLTFSKSILFTPLIKIYRQIKLKNTPIRIVNLPPYSINGTQFINNNVIDVSIVI